jgi:hypothetical protein
MKKFVILAITALFLVSAPACKNSKKAQKQPQKVQGKVKVRN